ncbi:RagB/SusD family nutrient uptake outer membrane protein [Pedobacter changchengzhani]|uniref:RagB/SusD family nutrient uptake outer membrane protein n=1 Tax=Pedobacter changchengzhani TaxID=2529274 RepID=A0A4R5MKH7_9SPHI|nr:RagB/SusD family nutrient uptake outer membrane protein [Pedobacter changchengzhani]TDG36174.1 RagB/SusD family nutrient uptake outer membrane protein [Pedobacter changchengzhani]
MKKIIIGMLAILTISISCKKSPLDISPDGRITLDAIFSDEKQTEAFLSTCYGNIPGYFYKYRFWAYLEGSTDNCTDADIGNESGTMNVSWISGALTPSFNPLEFGNGTASGMDGKANKYAQFWNGIYNANVFLSRLPTANVPIETNRNRFKGEAQLLRAFYYLELIKQYGALPIIDKPVSNTFDYTSLTRPTFQQCVDFIVSECDNVIANPQMPIRITLEGERGRFSKAVAYAIKSEALLYNASPLWNPSNDKAKWTAASTASQQALTALTAGNQYQLFPNYEQYFFSSADMSTTPVDKETIFEITSTNDGTFTIINAIAGQKGINKTGSTPTQELVDSYEMKATGLPAITGYSDDSHLNPIINTASGYDPNNPYVGRDPRFYASVWYNGAVHPNYNGASLALQIYKGGGQQLLKTPPNRQNTHSGYYLRKFLNPAIAVGTGSSARFKKYHLSEIYLNLAEAENEANGPTQIAYDAVNTVRARAGMPNLTPGLSQLDFQTRIRNERRVELFMEEHRFWDVRRWKILDKTDKLVTGTEIIKTGSTLAYNRFVVESRNAWQDKFRIFPLPLGEASIIPDFSKNQNPGW